MTSLLRRALRALRGPSRILLVCIVPLKPFSHRFVHVRYLKWTEEQIAENERLWAGEREEVAQ